MLTKDPMLTWMVRRHLDDVLRIEQEVFEHPWEEPDFLVCLRQRSHMGTVIEDYDTREVVGFLIYRLQKGSLFLVNLAVSKSHQRTGLARFAINRLISRLSQQRRTQIITEVRESNLTAQLFFSSLGFKAVRILPRHYDENNEAAYEMIYNLGDSE